MVGLGVWWGRKAMRDRVRNADPTLSDLTHLHSVLAVFVCVAALAILDRLDLIDVNNLAWWLCERQLPNGGLNGRPEKLEDVSGSSCFIGFGTFFVSCFDFGGVWLVLVWEVVCSRVIFRMPFPHRSSLFVGWWW